MEQTKADKRERKRRKARKMKVSGRSVKLLDEIQRRKAKEAKNKDRSTDASVPLVQCDAV